ncbi:MAG: HNH endonuclease [Firmicutes bacterium]|nr:HNH endonuclease [Bacillota bacterium]
MNAAYAFNWDRGNCRICGNPIWPGDLQVHHLSPRPPLKQFDRVSNLASPHKKCHRYLHHPTKSHSIGTKPEKRPKSCSN